MTATVKDAIDEIKQRIDIRSYIRGVLGTPEKKHIHRDYDEYLCPFHTERSRSFKVNEKLQVYRCFGACGDGGDLIDFVMRRYGMTIQDAVEHLSSGSFIASPPTQRKHEEHFTTELKMHDAERVYRHFDYGMSYFGPHGVSEDVGRAHMLGARIPKPHKYTMRDGEEIMIPSQRFAIPNLFGQHVINIALRRDDAYVLEVVKLLDYDLYRKVVHDWERSNPHKPIMDDADLLEPFGGAKYISTYGGRNAMFNVSLLCHQDADGSKRYKSVPSVIWTESEKEALLLLSLGYDAIARNPARDDVSELFQRVTRIVIPAHNDDGAGMGHAETKLAAGKFPRGKAQIITPPSPHKGLDDMYDAGESVPAFLERYGVYPTRRLS